MSRNISPKTGDSENTEDNRRRFLLGATSVLGGGAGLLSAVPFASSLRPSKKAQAEGAPVNVSVGNLAVGELRVTVWRLKPVWIFGRDQEMIDAARQEESVLSDPQSEASLQPSYCKNEFRSIKPDIFIAIGLCTHLGCSPGRAADKNGGFLCACHGSRFDVAGRVVKGSPAPTNLIIPPHRYAAADSVVIGEDESAG